jgi:hypothetical protein
VIEGFNENSYGNFQLRVQCSVKEQPNGDTVTCPRDATTCNHCALRRACRNDPPQDGMSFADMCSNICVQSMILCAEDPIVSAMWPDADINAIQDICAGGDCAGLAQDAADELNEVCETRGRLDPRQCPGRCAALFVPIFEDCESMFRRAYETDFEILQTLHATCSAALATPVDGYVLGTGRGSVSHEPDVCRSHADCSRGAYCDNTMHCWECESIRGPSGDASNPLWCDPYECADGSNCNECCGLAELRAHCSIANEFIKTCPVETQPFSSPKMPSSGH